MLNFRQIILLLNYLNFFLDENDSSFRIQVIFTLYKSKHKLIIINIK